MKRVLKGLEPTTLSSFKAANPDATWGEMRHDGLHNGRQAARDCLEQTISDQKGLCAYCETKIDPGEPHRCRVEHFHPKADSSANHNWNLDWQNMLATCNGGERDESPDTPLPDNLSCDAYKNHLLNKDRLSYDVEKSLANPLNLPAFPNFYILNKGTGRLNPDDSICRHAGVNTCKLQQSINVLNLNCERLARQRRQIVINVDKNKEQLRQRNYRPEEAGKLLAKRYFSAAWPEFFTTIRCCLGQAAESYLQNISYNG